MVLVWLAVVPAWAALQPISRVREIAQVAPSTRVVIRGTVTRCRPGHSLYVQDQTGSILVRIDKSSPVAVGDIVEVSGLADVDNDAPAVIHARYEKFGVAEAPVPIGVDARDLAQGKHDADLVAVEGTFGGVRTGHTEDGLMILADGVDFIAWVPKETAGSATALRPGSRVRVRGIVSINVTNGRPSGFELLMRTGDDAMVIRRAAWWTTRGAWTTAVVVAAVLPLLFSYVFLLQRQVRRQTAIIHQKLLAESELKEQYRQAQKMEAIGRLAGGIAHDFNNIMTVVLGHSEMLVLELKDHPELRTSAEEIRNAAERAAGLTRQLLAFSRRQKLDPAPVDLNAVARDMVSLLSRVLGGEIEVRAEAGAEAVTIETDRAQLEQALLNLAVNARDAMPEGGRLVLSVSRQARDGQTAAVMAVTDTGTGIALDVRGHIFDPFFTTKEVGRGSGLGLAMVYGFVQQSGGAIQVYSTVGGGTTFELAFPLTPPAARSRSDAC